MKLLILTQYYPPETGAPQNRLHELAIRLQQSGVQVHVLTAMPNYPKMEIFEGYRNKSFFQEEIDGIKVFRSAIYVKKSKNLFYRLLNYFSFVWSSLNTGSAKLAHYDYLLVESPPLFLGISAFLLSKEKRAKLIFNVSDLWPESAEKLGLVRNKTFLAIATWLEEFLYKNSHVITGQTQGIVHNIQQRFPAKKVVWLPNGADLEMYKPANNKGEWRIEQGFSANDFVLLYAGIIGHAQGLEIIIEVAKNLQPIEKLKIVLLGDGPIKSDLIAQSQKAGLKNLFFLHPVPKAGMYGVLNEINMAWVPLKKLPLFEGAIPSKIFENLSMEKPILLGVSGESKMHFIENAQAGVFYEPENAADMCTKLTDILEGKYPLEVMGKNGRTYVEKHFNRDSIAHDFLATLQQHNI